jgi:Holliday junction resolvase RusA-like endonuclease
VAIVIDFYVSRFRGDIDNLEKSLVDGLVKGGVIGDDRDVVKVSKEVTLTTTTRERVVVSITQVDQRREAE